MLSCTPILKCHINYIDICIYKDKSKDSTASDELANSNVLIFILFPGILTPAEPMVNSFENIIHIFFPIAYLIKCCMGSVLLSVYLIFFSSRFHSLRVSFVFRLCVRACTLKMKIYININNLMYTHKHSADKPSTLLC